VPDRRIGDKIAGTKLVIYDPETNNKPERSFKKYILPLLSAYAIFIALTFGLGKVSFNEPQTSFVANTYNASESKTLEKLLTDNFDQYYTVSVRCYDSIENRDLKYVSVICFFKESFLNKIGETDQIRNETRSQVYKLFSKELVTGQLQYVYRSGGNMTSWNEPIGITIK